MYSSVTLMGRLGADPDLRVTKSGEYVCNFHLAVDKAGADREAQPDWWRIKVWGKTAEFAANHLAKGGRVLVIGTPTLDEWEDEQGGHRAKLAASARSIQVIDWAGDGVLSEGVDGDPPSEGQAKPAPHQPASRPAPRPRQPARYPNHG